MISHDLPLQVREAVAPLTTGVAAVSGGVYRGLRPRAALKAELLGSRFKMPPALSDDTAPSASLGHLKAQATPMHPRA